MTTCPHCGLTYKNLRTGYCYTDIYEMLWSSNPDPATWRYKGRHSVLGFWHEIKLTMWEYHLEECALSSEEYNLPLKDNTDPFILYAY